MPESSKKKSSEIATEIKKLAESMKRLRELGVIRSQKIVGDIGEWIAAVLFDGVIADSKNQQGWDIKCEVGNIQVRAHAKAEGNNTRNTRITGLSEDCAMLAILVLTHDFRISQVFVVPSEEAKRLATKGKLSWSKLQDFEVPHADLLPSLSPLFI